MENKKQDFTNKGCPYQANVSSSGALSLDLLLTEEANQKLSTSEKEKLLSKIISQLSQRMIEDGYIDWMSAQDIANKHGNSRQYWDKLMKEGKIPYKNTAAGKITTNLWVKGFIEHGSDYSGNMNKARINIIEKYAEDKSENSTIKCPNCQDENSLSYHYNNGYHINGLCRKCGFRIDTQA